jgi:NAD(P)H-dependent flavin oxidoreductase YrpB (nitropropane dioxygenase family)
VAPITRLCTTLGIAPPIVGAGTGLTATARLAAAVTNAGGVGITGAAGDSTEPGAPRATPPKPGVLRSLRQQWMAQKCHSTWQAFEGAAFEGVDSPAEGGVREDRIDGLPGSSLRPLGLQGGLLVASLGDLLAATKVGVNLGTAPLSSRLG